MVLLAQNDTTATTAAPSHPTRNKAQDQWWADLDGTTRAFDILLAIAGIGESLVMVLVGKSEPLTWWAQASSDGWIIHTRIASSESDFTFCLTASGFHSPNGGLRVFQSWRSARAIM
jgi:hypothetical protein